MKPTTALLTASLLANVAFVAVYMTGPRPAENATVKPAAAMSARGAAGAGQPEADALRRALETGDAAALQAAGLSAEAARDLALGRSFARIAEKLRAARAAQSGDNRWWRQRDAAPGTREQMAQLRREFGDALLAAFGQDFNAVTGSGASYDFLAPEKRDALRRILQDYDEMMAKFGAGGIQLASDREKLRLLRAERDRDIAALLTPEERLAYEMRTSPSAATVRARYGDGIQTEEDFQKIYALQKAFDEKYPLDASTGRMTPEAMRQRVDAQRQLQDDMRAALGDEKFAALRRASDPDLRNVDSLVGRLNLAPATTDQIAAARESYAAESQRITADPAISAQQRRAQLQELGTKAKTDLARALGAEAGDAYAQRSPWVAMLTGGVAFSTTPPTGSAAAMLPVGQSVYPIMPAGSAGPGAVSRQVIMTGGPSADPVLVHGDGLFAPGSGPVRENVQVMTFTTSSSNDAAPAGAAQGERRVIAAPTPAPAATPKP